MTTTINEDVALFFMTTKGEIPQIELVRGIWYYDFEISRGRLFEEVKLKAQNLKKKNPPEYQEMKAKLEKMRQQYVQATGGKM